MSTAAGSSREAWGFLAEPGAAGLLHTLPESCRDRALSGCLMRVVNAAVPPEPIIDACRELASDPSAFAAEIAFIRILQGRLDDADAVFDALPPEVREVKRVRIGRAGARALAAMLRGDDAQARLHIESAVAEERAGTRKRNVFPASTAFALSCCRWCATIRRRAARCSRRCCAPPHTRKPSRSSCTTSPAPPKRARVHASTQ